MIKKFALVILLMISCHTQPRKIEVVIQKHFGTDPEIIRVKDTFIVGTGTHRMILNVINNSKASYSRFGIIASYADERNQIYLRDTLRSDKIIDTGSAEIQFDHKFKPSDQLPYNVSLSAIVIR